MTFDLHQGHHHSQLASGLLLTKYGSHSTKFTPFDLWWPLTSIKVIIILSLHQDFFWPNMVAIVHSLSHLTSDDLWPPSRSPCTPSALALPTYQISSRWGIRFPRNAPDNFCTNYAIKILNRHLPRPKFSMRNFRPSPNHIPNIIKVDHTVPEICSGQKNHRRRMPHRHLDY